MSFESLTPPEGFTLEQAKAWLRERLTPGAVCPCCTQLAKLYKRKLNATMARGLIWLVRESGDTNEWVDVSEEAPKWLIGKGGTLATLAHWDLIAPKMNDDETKRASGIWRPTARGRRFALGQLSQPRHVFLYDGRRMRFSEDVTDIETALGDKFNYEELMAS